jgi:hypothetical protein
MTAVITAEIFWKENFIADEGQNPIINQWRL